MSNVAKNMLFSNLLQAIVLVCGVFFPQWIIQVFGSSINGLTQSINQVINVLYLLQAGAVGSFVFALYKPISKCDYDKVNSIMYSQRIYFNKIGGIFLICIFVIAPMMGLLNTESSISSIDIILSILILGLNASFTFFFFSWFETLFHSYQQIYWFSISTIVDKMVYYSLMVLVLNAKLHFIAMYIAMVIGAVAKLVFLYAVYRKKYGDKIKTKVKASAVKVAGKGYLFVNQVCIQAVESAPMLVITFFCGLKYASVFSVYYMIYGLLKSTLNTFVSSSSTSFADYSLTHSEKETKNVFILIQYTFSMAGAWVAFCCGGLFVSFIKLYTLNITDINYYYPTIAMIGVMELVGFTLYIPYYMLTNVYGYFKDVYLKSIVCALFVISLSVAVTLKVGFMYAAIGPVLYFIIMGIVRMTVAKKNISWFSYRKCVHRGLFTSCLALCGCAMGQWAVTLIESWKGWILAGIISAVIGILALVVYSSIFERNEAKTTVEYLRSIIMKKRRKIV